MKELMDKVSSYNLFNYLFPGVVFVVLAGNITSYSLIQDDIVVGAFLYYFIGLVVSRVGSLILEPIFKRLAFVKLAPYEDYVAVSKTDSKLEILSEANNTYRTLSSLFMLLALLKIYELLAARFQILASLSSYILVGALFALFIFSYRKQTQYVTKRINSEKS